MTPPASRRARRDPLLPSQLARSLVQHTRPVVLLRRLWRVVLGTLGTATVTTREFVRAAQRAYERWPEGVLVKNQVGNVAVLVDGVYVGFIDLNTGDVDSV